MTDRGSYAVLEYDQLTAERDKLAFDLHHQKEVYAGAVLTVNRLTVERDALKAECEDLREAAKDCSGEDHQPYCRHYKRLKADNERLRAELRERDLGNTRLFKDNERLRELADGHASDSNHFAKLADEYRAHLTELREAAQACVDNAHSLKDDCYHVYAPMVDALESALAKVTP